MADIRKRVGKKGTTYQVRYASKATKSGYTFKTFGTLMETRGFREDSASRNGVGLLRTEIDSVCQAVDKWLDICVKEGRDGRDPVTPCTRKSYEYRADIMKSYDWDKPLFDLQSPDIVEFRSWLLSNYSRNQVRKVLSSFHSVMKEMALRGHLASNIATQYWPSVVPSNPPSSFPVCFGLWQICGKNLLPTFFEYFLSVIKHSKWG